LSTHLYEVIFERALKKHGTSGGLARIPDNTGGDRKIILFTMDNG
jgi:hypothetical protein